MSYDAKSNTSVVLCELISLDRAIDLTELTSGVLTGRPITGRTHQIRVHLQYLGHPIANDPIYQNSAAWGSSGGKGGVYSSVESKAAIEARRERGEAFMEAEKEKEKEKNNAYREIKEGEEGIDRRQHNLVLTEGAEKAIRALRGVRDEVDGWARDRDVEGLEKARKAQLERLSEGQDEKSQGDSGEGAEDEGEGFCKKCFTPLIPDPQPRQLFIWLHAMRCKFHLIIYTRL